jgi:hypothetical protein
MKEYIVRLVASVCDSMIENVNNTVWRSRFYPLFPAKVIVTTNAINQTVPFISQRVYIAHPFAPFTVIANTIFM